MKENRFEILKKHQPGIFQRSSHKKSNPTAAAEVFIRTTLRGVEQHDFYEKESGGEKHEKN